MVEVTFVWFFSFLPPLYNYYNTQYLTEGEINNKEIAKIILKESPKVNKESTACRRAQTVVSWIKWIMNLTVNYEHNPFERNN